MSSSSSSSSDEGEERLAIHGEADDSNSQPKAAVQDDSSGDEEVAVKAKPKEIAEDESSGDEDVATKSQLKDTAEDESSGDEDVAAKSQPKTAAEDASSGDEDAVAAPASSGDDEVASPTKPKARILDSDDDFDDGADYSPPPAQAEKEADSDAEKRSRASSSSSDDAAPAATNATQEELFGDGADLSSDEDEPKAADDAVEDGKRSPLHPDDIVGPRLHMEELEGEGEGEPAGPAETVIDVAAPRIRADLGNQIHFLKFPNFLSVEARPFDPETYEDEIDEEDMMDEEGRSRLKLKVENTIRWRQFLDPATGQLKKDSNAKFVKWSDGTLSLYLGSEIFDIHVQPTTGDHNHLFIRQGAGLQGQDMFRTKLTFRPHSTDTLTHRKMTLSMADRGAKAHTVKVLSSVGLDPETQKAEMVRREEERLRTAARREAQSRRVREREAGLGRPGFMSSGYLEERGGGGGVSSSGDEDETSISAIKKSYAPGGAGFDGIERDSDDSEAGRGRLAAAKRTLEDSDEDDAAATAAKKKKRVIEDSDDDEPKAPEADKADGDADKGKTTASDDDDDDSEAEKKSDDSSDSD